MSRRKSPAAQLGLFDRPFTPFVKGSVTSKAAAVAAQPAAPTAEARVLEVIVAAAAHGATDDEIEKATGLSHQSASARRRGLVLAGKVKDSGTTRLTHFSRRATVWVAA